MLVVLDVDLSDKERGALDLCDAFEAVMGRARREAASLPPLHKSGVRYVSQSPKACAMRCPRSVYERKGGDCKQLVLWRIAELRNHGVHAMPRIIWLTPEELKKRGAPNTEAFSAHAQVRLPNGDIEDPSFDLGMKA